MKKLTSSFVALFAMMAFILLGSAGTAQATGTHDAECEQNAVSLVVICDIDIYAPIFVENPDVVVEIEENEILSDITIGDLETVIKDTNILNGTYIDVNLLKAVIADFLDVDVSKVTVYLCAIQSHSHCH